MSSIAPSATRRCSPRFPTEGVLLDNSALVRLWKCECLEVLSGTVELHVASRVATEFKCQGPSQRRALDDLGVTVLPVRPGTSEWTFLAGIRGGQRGTKDFGEDESLAVALAQAEREIWLPFVTYDKPSTNKAVKHGVVTLDFLDTLAWLVGCGVLPTEKANAIEDRAQDADGWKRPVGYTGDIESVQAARQSAMLGHIKDWQRE